MGQIRLLHRLSLKKKETLLTLSGSKLTSSVKKQYLPQDINLHSLCDEDLEPLEGKSWLMNYTSHQDALSILTLRTTPCLTVLILVNVPVPSELNNYQVEALKL